MENRARIGDFIETDEYIENLEAERQYNDMMECEERYINHLITEYEKDKIIKLNNDIKEYEYNYESIVRHFESLAIVPNNILLKLKDIIKYRIENYPNCLFEHLRKHSETYNNYLLNIANIIYQLSIINEL